MSNINTVTLSGRMTKNPELKQTNTGVLVCEFSIAVNRFDGTKEVADFYNIVAWKNNADFVCKYGAKGANIFVTGSLKTEQFTDNEGKERKAIKIVANNIDLPKSATNESAVGISPAVPQTPQYSPPSAGNNYEQLNSDDELPF